MARGARVSRGTRTRFQRSAGRKFVWARRLILNATVPANSAVFSDLLTDFQTALGADVVGTTIVRIRGMWQITDTSPLVMGVRIMTQSSFPNLDPATQGPAQDQYADWFAYQPLMTNNPSVTDFTTQEIDIRSSRKMEEIGQGLLLAVDNPTATPGGFTMDLSIGLKLP